MKRHCEESSRRWNFDFEGERPLAGRFAWKMAPAAEIGAAATVFVPPSLVPARLSPQLQQAALDNRENMAEVSVGVGGRRVRSQAATPPVGFQASSSSFSVGGGGGVDLLAGSPAGSLDDLRTPAPPSSPPPTAAQSSRGTEPAAAQAANRLSDSTTRAAEELGGARPKTKEQKITGRKIKLYSTVL
jgi:hypothetical protein